MHDYSSMNPKPHKSDCMVSKLKYVRTLALSNPKEKRYSNWHTQLEAQALIVLISQFTITVVFQGKKDFTEQWRSLA